MPAVKLYSGMVKVEGCYSGVLTPNKHSFTSRVALATPEALATLKANRFLLSCIQGHYIEKRELSERVLDTAGLNSTIFSGLEGFQTWGLWTKSQGQEEIFLAARERLKSLAEGQNRSVFFAVMGVKAQGIDDLTSGTYAAMLAKLAPHFNDRLLAISVHSGQNDCLTLTRHGVEISFAEPLLHKYPFWSHINDSLEIEEPEPA
jgi:hypothetical protein